MVHEGACVESLCRVQSRCGPIEPLPSTMPGGQCGTAIPPYRRRTCCIPRGKGRHLRPIPFRRNFVSLFLNSACSVNRGQGKRRNLAFLPREDTLHRNRWTQTSAICYRQTAGLGSEIAWNSSRRRATTDTPVARLKRETNSTLLRTTRNGPQSSVAVSTLLSNHDV